MFGRVEATSGAARTNLRAAWPRVRSPDSVRKESCSTFFRPVVSHSFGRWRRWSFLAKVVFEEVVDHLHAFYPALAHRPYAFFEPADLGSEGDAVGPDLALALELFHKVKEPIVLDGVHLGVVKLEEVYVVRVEPLQALLQGEAKKVLGPVLRALLLAAPGRMFVEVVADLRRDHHLVPHVPEGVSEERLSFARAVRVRGVEVVDAPFAGLPEESYGPLVVHRSPPAGRDRPHSEAYFGDRYISAAQRTIFHLPLPVCV